MIGLLPIALKIKRYLITKMTLSLVPFQGQVFNNRLLKYPAAEMPSLLKASYRRSIIDIHDTAWRYLA